MCLDARHNNHTILYMSQYPLYYHTDKAEIRAKTQTMYNSHELSTGLQ